MRNLNYVNHAAMKKFTFYSFKCDMLSFPFLSIAHLREPGTNASGETMPPHDCDETSSVSTEKYFIADADVKLPETQSKHHVFKCNFS